MESQSKVGAGVIAIPSEGMCDAINRIVKICDGPIRRLHMNAAIAIL